jgi:hypothetical protein
LSSSGSLDSKHYKKAWYLDSIFELAIRDPARILLVRGKAPFMFCFGEYIISLYNKTGQTEEHLIKEDIFRYLP